MRKYKMISVTTLNSSAIHDYFKEFQMIFKQNSKMKEYPEALPLSFIMLGKFADIQDDSIKTLDVLKDFFSGLFSFNVFYFLQDRNKVNVGQLQEALKSKYSNRSTQRFIIDNWATEIQAQRFVSDRPLMDDPEFMNLFQQDSVPCFYMGAIHLIHFFEKLCSTIYHDRGFLRKNNTMNFSGLLKETEKSKDFPFFLAFHNPKNRSLLFYYYFDYNMFLDSCCLKFARPINDSKNDKDWRN